MKRHSPLTLFGIAVLTAVVLTGCNPLTTSEPPAGKSFYKVLPASVKVTGPKAEGLTVPDLDTVKSVIGAPVSAAFNMLTSHGYEDIHVVGLAGDEWPEGDSELHVVLEVRTDGPAAIIVAD